MNITPGTLCLVIGGRNVGRACTVVRVARPMDVQSVISNALHKVCKLVDYPGDPIWEVDELMAWGPRKDPSIVWCEIPYMRQEYLLPIPPLAEPTEVEQQERMKA